MPTYHVSFSTTGYVTYEVEAASEKNAIEKCQKEPLPTIVDESVNVDEFEDAELQEEDEDGEG